MAEHLSVPYKSQQQHGYCLPACTQMVLAHLGILRSQTSLAQELGVYEDFGVPASHIVKLRSKSLEVLYRTEANLDEIQDWLSQQVPVIVFVQTAQLEYWQKRVAQHAVTVIGMDKRNIYLLDPAHNSQEITVPIDEFWLAWDEMQLAYTVLQKRK